MPDEQEIQVHTIELTDDEVTLMRAALTAFFDDFGHEQQDTLRAIHALLDKLPAAPEEEG